MMFPPADGTFETVPYHLIGSPETIAEQFVLYCTDRFSRDDFEDEVNCEAPVWCNGCSAWHALGMAKTVTRVP